MDFGLAKLFMLLVSPRRNAPCSDRWVYSIPFNCFLDNS